MAPAPPWPKVSSPDRTNLLCLAVELGYSVAGEASSMEEGPGTEGEGTGRDDVEGDGRREGEGSGAAEERGERMGRKYQTKSNKRRWLHTVVLLHGAWASRSKRISEWISKEEKYIKLLMKKR